MFLRVVILMLVGIHCSFGWDDFELEALLAFKQNLIVSDSLSNWSRENSHQLCLNWEGVSCNNVTGHVEKLEFGGPNYELDAWAGRDLKGPISPSIWNLRYLVTMKMCCNHFSGTIPPLDDISSGLKSLKTLDLSYNSIRSPLPQLEHLPNLMMLDLSFNLLNGTIPLGIPKLRNLKILSLRSNQISGDIPEELGRMESLTDLDLSDNNLTGTIEVLTNCSSLKCVFLEDNLNLGGTIPRNIDIKIKLLENLHLGGTSITGKIPPELGNCSKLSAIKTSPDMQGPIPLSLARLPQLKVLDLEGLEQRGLSLPLKQLLNMSKLEVLNLGGNNATISFPSLMGDSYLLYLALDSNRVTDQFPDLQRFVRLEVLILDTCGFNGPFPRSTMEMNTLKFLKLSNNNFSGEFPDIPKGSWQNLVALSIHNNTFTGVIPLSLGQLSNLRSLHMNHNKFTGTVPVNFGSMLVTLDLSENMLSGNINNLFKDCTNLATLNLQDNEFQGGLPNWLENCTQLVRLQMGGNRLAGKIQVDLTKLTVLEVLELPNNTFEGEVPMLASGNNTSVLDLSGNNFSGQIPTFISEFRKLRVLSLRGNKFSGTISDWLWKTLGNLQVLDLSDNRLTGTFPSGNILEGFKSSKGVFDPLVEIYSLPYQCNKSPSRSFSFLEFSATGNGDEFKFYKDRSRATLYEEVFIQVKRNGRRYEYVLSTTTLLDLSSNMLTGVIPASICDLVELRYLVLYQNNFVGQIPDCTVNIHKLEQLDLSHNQITGRIPETLANLYTLALFDVSYNQLEGRIPWEGQLSTFNESSYEGNPGLCGRPLLKNCSGNGNTTTGGELMMADGFGAWWKDCVSPFGFASGCVLGVGFGLAIALTL